jgi:hypothetical protein
MKRLMSAVTGLLALLCGLLAASASAAQYYDLAGRELSPGFGSGEITYLVLFAGWTLDEPTWAPITSSTGGAWTANIRREGDAAFGSEVEIIGGNWTLQQPDGTTRWGRMFDGLVVWPEHAADDIGCGDGVAQVWAAVSLGFPWGWPWRQAGEIGGCLDDQEWLEDSDSFRLPPRIWATLILY